jgi:uncharacterized protein (TIGR00369 family)
VSGDGPPPTGLEQLRAAAFGPDRQPHIGDVLGMEVVSLAEGAVVFALRAEPRFANYSGTMHGGVCATLLDSVMGCAVHSALGPGLTCTALEIKVNFVRPVVPGGARLVAEGRTIHVGRTIATAEGTVRDERDRLIAHGTGTHLVQPR